MIKLHLYEGKKQAKQILGDLANVQYKGNSILFHLLAFDPTETNKYVEIYARWLKEEYKKGIKLGWDKDPILEHSMDRLYNIIPDDWGDLILKAEEKGFDEDVSKISDLEEFVSKIQKAALRLTGSSIKLGIQGMTSGVDYEMLYETEEMWAIQPFSWEASKILASNYVGHCEGEWCIAYQKDRQYWDEYTTERGEAPVFMIVKNEDHNIEYLKYSFMYGDEYLHVWNAIDNRDLGSRPIENTRDIQSILNDLGMTYKECDAIGVKARENAEEKIENFGGNGEVHEVRQFSSYYDIQVGHPDQDGDIGVAEGRVSIELLTWTGNNDGDTDYDSEYFESVDGDIYVGNIYFTAEEGYNILQQLHNDDLLEGNINFIENSLVIKYDGKSFGTHYDEMENHQYDDSNDDYRDYEMRELISKYNITSIIILSQDITGHISTEPFVETFRHVRSVRGTQGEVSEFTEIKLNGIDYTLAYLTINTDSMKDYITSHPKLSSILSDWVRNDDREKEMGQQFLQFEHTNLMKFLKQYKATLKG